MTIKERIIQLFSKYQKMARLLQYKNKDSGNTLFEVETISLLELKQLELELQILINDELDRLEKLEKAIDILKGRIEFEDFGEMENYYLYRPYFNECLDDKEYKLLKEVI